MAAQGIAQGMNKYYQKKEENDRIAKAADMFSVAAQKNPFLAQAMGIQDVKDTAAIKNAIKGAGGPGKFTQIASGIHEMGMREQAAQQAQREYQLRLAENARQDQELKLRQAQDARQKVESDRKDALYQQGQAQVADMRNVNAVATGIGSSPLSNAAVKGVQMRLAADPSLRDISAITAATGRPIDDSEVVRIRLANKKDSTNLFKTQAEAQAALAAGGGRGSIQQGANGWSVRLDSGQDPTSERERLIKLTVGLEQKPNRTPEEELTLKYYKESLTKMNTVGSFLEQYLAGSIGNLANKAP